MLNPKNFPHKAGTVAYYTMKNKELTEVGVIVRESLIHFRAVNGQWKIDYIRLSDGSIVR